MSLDDVRPPALDLLFRPGTTVPRTLEWPTGELAGRTFSSTLDGVALDLTVLGDVMTVEASATVTGTHDVGVPATWLLLEEINGTDEPVFVGTWTPSDDPRDLDASGSTTVVVGGSTVIVTVTSGQASIAAIDTRVDNLETADVALDGRLDTAEESLITLDGRVDVAEADIATLDLSAIAFRRQPTHQPPGPLARYRADAARARSGQFFANSAVTAWLGDSFTEGYEPSKRGLRWIEHLARRLNGLSMRKVRYYPITTNTLSSTAAGDWPGDQPPWTYNGTINGSVDFGADLHAATLSSGAFVELPYFGDIVNVAYTRTPTGPSAAAVTIDGVSAGTINANGSELPGQIAAFGTTGDYGAHTLRVTATGAPLLLEGAVVHDGTRFGFGVPHDSIHTFAFGHAGFATSHFVNNTNWSKSLAALVGSAIVLYNASLIGIVLGANDAGASVPAATFQANLVTLMQRIDADIDASGVTTDPGFLLVMMPTTTDAYLSAAFTAAAAIGSTRCGVLDLRQYLPGGGTGWGIFDAGNAHPNDAGHLWIANTIADYIDGPSATGALPEMPPGGPVIRAADAPTARSNWTESFGVASGQTFDSTPADSTVRERRHRTWFEAGTYSGRLRFGEVTTLGGVFEVFVGHTSLGTTGATTGTTGNVNEVALSTPVVIDSPGAYPVTVRKLGTNAGAARFVELRLRKTA